MTPAALENILACVMVTVFMALGLGIVGSVFIFNWRKVRKECPFCWVRGSVSDVLRDVSEKIQK